jgi:hypothetical protein
MKEIRMRRKGILGKGGTNNLGEETIEIDNQVHIE